MTGYTLMIKLIIAYEILMAQGRLCHSDFSLTVLQIWNCFYMILELDGL